MATLIRCPRCKSETDASASKPGSIIKCVHCRGDMRVPDAAPSTSSPGGAGHNRQGGGRQSTLFRKMTNATVPGQRGRTAPMPVGGGQGRGAAETKGRDLSGLYLGGGIAALIAVIIAIGFVMKGKGEEPKTAKGGPRKEVAPRPMPAPPPPPPAPIVPAKPPDREAVNWEPDAMNFAPTHAQKILVEKSMEKEALELIRAGNSNRILQQPFKLMPFVINSLVDEDRDLARESFKILHAFCEDRNIKFEGGINPVKLGQVNNAEYRGYTFGMMYEWWRDRASKLPDAPGNLAAVEKTDWLSTLRELKGGAYHDESQPQGVTFLRVKNLGRAAWPKIAEFIDHEDLTIGRTAAQVLIELTKEKKPLPNEQNRAEVKNAWLTWLKDHK